MTDITEHHADAPAKPKHPLTLLSHKLDERRDKYDKQLRAVGIDFDTFKAAALTGVNRNPDLLTADQASLYDSLSQACRDGLLPDGRQGALVIHRTNVAKRGQPAQWVDQVAWMPMVRGILKKIRGADGVASVHDGVIYKDDAYDYWIDDEGPHLKHRPSLGGSTQDSDIIAAYAIVRLTNGDQQIEVVGSQDLVKMQQASKSGKNGNGPWKTWKAQMAKKSAWHRLAPKLPLDDAIMETINRDEALYDFDRREQDVTPEQAPKAEPGKSRRLSALTQQHATQPQEEPHDDAAAQPDA